MVRYVHRKGSRLGCGFGLFGNGCRHRADRAAARGDKAPFSRGNDPCCHLSIVRRRGSNAVISDVKFDTVDVSNRPILLKNSIAAFPTANVGVSNHHPIKLRRSERVSRGSMFSRVYDCGIAVEFFKCKGLPRPEATLESHGIECQD